MNGTTELKNVFQAAADIQRHPSEIRTAARSLGIEPVSRYAGLALYSVEQLQQIEQALQEASSAH